MTIEVGALEQAYAKVEGSYGASAGSGGESLSATDAIRHLELSLSAKNNREPSPEKRGTPDEAQSLPRRPTQGFNLSSIMWEPSGTIGTISNVGKFIKAGFGAAHSFSLVTDINDASPTATGFTLTSVTGLAVDDIIIVTMPDGSREATRVLSIVSLTITCDELSTAPEDNAVVVAGITYKPASNITETLAVYKYYNAGGFKQATFGNVVDQIQATFDGTREVMLAIQGPGGRYADSNTPSNAPTEAPPQSKPASHTTVGAPASGMIGNFNVDENRFTVINVQVTINNNLELRNKELGTRYATGIAGRANLRKVNVRITFYCEDMLIFALATQSGITSQTGKLRFVVGDTNGGMLACVMPKVEFEIPDVGNEIGPKELTIDGVAYATSGNDQVFFSEA